MSEGPNIEPDDNEMLFNGKANLWKGVIWCFVGLMGTVFSYATDSGFGGTVIISWGAFLNGIFFLGRGTIEVDKVRQNRSHDIVDNPAKSAKTEIGVGSPANFEKNGRWRRTIVSVWVWVVVFVLIWQLFDS